MNKLDVLISGVSSFSQLKYYSSTVFICNEDNNLICKVCKTEFKYIEDSGADKRIFRNLKISIKRHISSKSHNLQAQQAKQEELANKQKLSEARTAALNCAKAAYLVYKQDLSYDSYSFLVQFAHETGGLVGTKNHSRYFPSIFLPHVTSIVRKTIFEYICGEPFGLTADKMTSLGHVRHIFGIRISQLNETDSELCALDIYLSHSIVTDSTAEGLACHLIKSLEQFGFDKVQIRKYLSGMAFDGQYIKLGVSKFIKEQLLIQTESELPLSWDPMHKVELCQKDAKTCFVFNTCEIINSAMKYVKQGKHLEILISFSELCDTFYKPKIFKDMKFVAHAQNVFSTFFNYFPAIVATLSQSDNELRESIMTPDFVLNFLFLQEIISVLASLSKQFQKSNQLPYKYPRVFNAFMINLQVLIDQSDAVLVVINKVTETMMESQNPNFKDFTWPESFVFPTEVEEDEVSHIVSNLFKMISFSNVFQKSFCKLFMPIYFPRYTYFAFFDQVY